MGLVSYNQVHRLAASPLNILWHRLAEQSPFHRSHAVGEEGAHTHHDVATVVLLSVFAQQAGLLPRPAVVLSTQQGIQELLACSLTPWPPWQGTASRQSSACTDTVAQARPLMCHMWHTYGVQCHTGPVMLQCDGVVFCRMISQPNPRPPTPSLVMITLLRCSSTALPLACWYPEWSPESDQMEIYMLLCSRFCHTYLLECLLAGCIMIRIGCIVLDTCILLHLV